MSTSNRHLLAANYVTYAECTVRMFRVIDEYLKNRKSNEKITIYTCFNSPIEKWFNVSAISRLDLYCCPDWWSNEEKTGYIDKIANMAMDKNVEVKICRLVGVDVASMKQRDIEQIGIYYEGRYPKRIDLNDLNNYRDGEVYKYKGVELLLQPSAEDIVELEKIFLLGKLPEGNMPNNWKKMIRCFENDYHSPVDKKLKSINEYKDGVYYRYVDKDKINGLLSKDDLFIVKVRSCASTDHAEQGVPFGMYYNENSKMDTSGIKLLDQDEIINTSRSFEKIWENGYAKLKDLLETK